MRNQCILLGGVEGEGGLRCQRRKEFHSSRSSLGSALSLSLVPGEYPARTLAASLADTSFFILSFFSLFSLYFSCVYFDLPSPLVPSLSSTPHLCSPLFASSISSLVCPLLTSPPPLFHSSPLFFLFSLSLPPFIFCPSSPLFSALSLRLLLIIRRGIKGVYEAMRREAGA